MLNRNTAQIAQQAGTSVAPNAASRSQNLLWAVLIVAATLAIYSIWLPQLYSGDDLQYATVIEQAVNGGPFYHPVGLRPFEPGAAPEIIPPAVNPRYLIEWPTSVAVAGLWKTLGWGGTVILPVLSWRILVGGLGVLGLFLAARRLSGSPLAAAIVAAGMAFSAGYWTYSTHLDQTINMVALTTLAIYLLVRISASDGARASLLLLPLVMVVATFYNFTATIAALIFGIGAAWMAGARPADRLRHFFIYSLIYGGILVGGLVLGISLGAEPGALTDPAFWRGATFAGHPEYEVDLVRDGARSALGFAKGQLNFPGAEGSLQQFWEAASGSQKIALAGFYGTILLGMAAPMLLLATQRRRIAAQPGRLALAATIAAWGVAYSGFNIFWDPGYIKYWILPLLAWWALVAIGLGLLRESGSRRQQIALIAAGLLAAASLVMNLTTQFIPHSGPEARRWQEIAATVGEQEGEALFISTGHQLDFYVTFFTRKDVVATSLVRYATGGDQAAMQERIGGRAASYTAYGAPVYLYGLEQLSDAERAETLALLDNPQLQPTWEFDGLTIYQIVP